MRRLTSRLNVQTAYPGKLGPQVIQAPAGFVFLIDGEGNYLTDDQGNYLMIPES